MTKPPTATASYELPPALGKKLSIVRAMHSGQLPQARADRREMLAAGRAILGRLSPVPLLRPLPPSPFPGPGGSLGQPLDGGYSVKDLSSLETKYPIGGCAQPTEPAQPQRFDLTFRSLKSSDLWSATDEVRYCCGVAGWCGCSHAAPTLSNLNGKGRLEGTLDWYWEGMVPQSGVYRVKPSVCLSHTGYCFADGVVQAGLDALATTIIEPALMLDDELLSFQPFPLAQSVPLATATSRLFPDTAWISGFTTLCSQEIHFRAQQDQFLRLLISVRGVAWTEPGSEADAEVFLSRVGVISNTLSDLDIPAAPF